MKKLILSVGVLLAVSSAFADAEVFGKNCSVSGKTFVCGQMRVSTEGCSISCGILPLDVAANCESAYAIRCDETGYEIAPAQCWCE